LNIAVDHVILYNLSFFDEVSMDSTYAIRAAKPEDISAIDNLCLQLGYEVDRDDLKLRFYQISNDPEQLLRVAADEGDAVVGWVHALPVCYLESETFIEIGGLVVDFACRRMGIGQALMASVEDWAREGGFSAIRLRSNSKRTTAHEFYRSIGYEVVKQQYSFVKELF
jgi:GNAT superfamily N-acetyltransferase